MTDDSSIVVVHDIVGDHLTTRTQRKDNASETVWLEDFLQRTIPHANIMSFSTNSDSPIERLLTARGLDALAYELLISIWRERETLQVYAQPENGLLVGLAF